MTTKPLPEFKNPPVVEVVLSLQFERLEKFSAVEIGVLWERHFRNKFPKTEFHPPIEPVFETFGSPTPRVGVKFEIIQGAVEQRIWFVSESGNELIQLQSDRFIHNWRKVGEGDTYPRYQSIRKTFETEAKVLMDFIAERKLGSIHPTQCEVGYINHLSAGFGWKNQGEMKDILEPWAGNFNDEFLPTPEDIRIQMRFPIYGPEQIAIGRLHMSCEPSFRKIDGHPMLQLNLTSRGRPLSSDLDGILGFLDLGREFVVRGFSAVTSKNMHAHWERQQ